MKEQVQLPYDTRGDTTDKERDNKPKALSRPALASGFEKPRISVKAGVLFQNCCACSSANCDAPAELSTYTWEYRDKDGTIIEGGGPSHGPRCLPGYDK